MTDMTREAVEQKIFEAFCLGEGVEAEAVDAFEVPPFDLETPEVPFQGVVRLYDGRTFIFRGEFDGSQQSISPLEIQPN